MSNFMITNSFQQYVYNFYEVKEIEKMPYRRSIEKAEESIREHHQQYKQSPDEEIKDNWYAIVDSSASLWAFWGLFWLIFRFFKSPHLVSVVRGVFKYSYIFQLSTFTTILFTDVNPGKDCKNKHPAKQLKFPIAAHALISNLIFFFMFREPAVLYIELEMHLRNDPDYEPYI